MIVETARALVLDGDAPLGGADAGKTLTACAARLVKKHPGTPVALDLEGLTYRCESEVFVRPVDGVRPDFTFGTSTGGGVRALTVGPYPEGTIACRNRAHIIFDDCVRAVVTAGVRIQGPHPDSGTGRSSDMVNPDTGRVLKDHLEQQCGIWYRNCDYAQACSVDIDHVWGDFVDFGTRTNWSIDEITQEAVIVPGRWDRNGRVGVLANCNNMLLQGGDLTRITRCVSSFYHVEQQSSFERAGVRNHRVQGLVVESCGGFCDFSGTHIAENISLTNNMRLDGPIDCKFVPAIGTRIKTVSVSNNGWASAGVGGSVMNAWNVDGFLYQWNNGPIRDAESKLVTFNNCTGVIRLPNNLTRV